MNLTCPLLFHIPHASTAFPPGARNDLLLDDRALADELLRMTDAVTDAIFLPSMRPGDEALVFPWSRLLVDVERFRNDQDEPMARMGMGAVYMRTSQGVPLRPAGFDSESLRATYYDPHHALLARLIRRLIDERGGILILDCHSFPSKPLSCDLDQEMDRPEICIGTDPFHSPQELIEQLEATFSRRGWRCLRDRPYAGTMVPREFFGKDPRVMSVMIEIRRDLYMDEETGTRHGVEKLAGIVREALDEIRGDVTGLLGESL